jgi:AraC-like DNA-binding protein
MINERNASSHVPDEERRWYYVPNKSLPGFDPLTFGEEKCRPLHCRGVSVCDYWIIHYVSSGRGIVVVDDVTYEVGASQCFILRPYEHFFYQADEHDPWHYTWISFRSDADMSAFDGKVVMPPSSGLHDIFLKIMKAKDIRYGQQEYLSARIWDIFSCFYNETGGATSRSNEYVERAKRYIEVNYMNDIGVFDISEMLGLERTYFSALFKRETGISPRQYLMEYRFNRAAELLSEHNYTVSQAAYAVGYFDIGNFSRMFKHFFGVSATEYKQLQKK